MSNVIDFSKWLCYNVFGAVLVRAQVVFLLEVDTRSMEGGEGMLEILLAMGFVYLCYAILLYMKQINRTNRSPA